MRSILALALVALAMPARAEERAADIALMTAIAADDVAAAQAALAGGADTNRRIDFGATPLAAAVETQDAALVTMLLAKGARPDVTDVDGTTPLGLACERGGADVVAALLDAKADVRATRPDGAGALAICARFGPADAVARILKAGAPVDRPDARGQTPLMWAASGGNTPAIARLLGAGANVDRVTKAGFTPLLFAIKSGVPAAADALIAAGARTGVRGPEHASALQIALYQRNWPVAATLVAHSANLAERDRNGDQPLHAAAAGGDVALVRALLAAGADANGLTGPSRITWVTEANFGVAPPVPPPMTALLVAALNGRADAMAALVAGGADPHFVAADGTGLVLAAARGRSAAALAYALDIVPGADVADAKGLTPLHRLLADGMIPDLAPMLRLLNAGGARADRPDARGITPAAMADGGLTEVRTTFRAIFPISGATLAAHR